MQKYTTEKQSSQESHDLPYGIVTFNTLGNSAIPYIPFRTPKINAGGCYQRKGRRTWRVWYPWKDSQGKRKKIFVDKYLDGSPLYNREYAETVLQRIRIEVDQGIFDPSSWGKEKSLQFENAWRIYQRQCRVGKDRMEARERIFKDFLLPYFKGYSLKDIGEHHIMEWWETIPAHAPSYLKVIRATLKAFLNFHPITRTKMFKFPIVKVPKKVPQWLSKKEQEIILAFVLPNHQPIIRFLMTYGCRVSEAANLRKGDVDLQKNIIVFRDRKNGKDNPLPLFDELKLFLILKNREISDSEPVFCAANGKQYTRQVLYRIWIDACKKAKVKIIPLKNATRHSLACQLLAEGKSSSIVSRILGNTPGVVEKSYGAINLQTVAEALGKSFEDGHHVVTHSDNVEVIENIRGKELVN